VNAASKGHLPIVRYLLTKQLANPLVRNNWGETAYDTSAAVFEVWICEVRQLLLSASATSDGFPSSFRGSRLNNGGTPPPLMIHWLCILQFLLSYTRINDSILD